MARNAGRTDDLSAAVTDTVATLVAMVPEGLVLLSTIAFAVSALALARRNVLVNELTAVEALARTDVVCVDKTETLTDREPTFAGFVPLAGAVAGSGDGVAATLATLVAQHRRVLLLARADELAPGGGLPAELVPVGFAVLTETIRPDAAATVRYLGGQGIELRVLSGDDARTVGAVAGDVGVPGAAGAVDARTLGEAGLRAAMAETTVFGRVSPEQKSTMLDALQDAGHTVAMTGDGVNDVIALKGADLGIAMGSGVPAARAVAQVVLLDDRFASVPHIMAEGRRVVTNAERVANLFLTKSVWAGVLAVAVVVADVPYPFLPRQITLVGSLAIGAPAFFLALDRTARRYRPGFVRRVLRFAVPAGGVVVLAVFGAWVVADRAGMGVEEARSLGTIVLLLVSLGVLVVLEWPVAGWRLAVAGAMVLLGAPAFAIPWVRDFFALSVPPLRELAAVVGIAVLATGAIAALTAGVRRERGKVTSAARTPRPQ